MSDRSASLDSMLKTELRAECERLDAELADLRDAASVEAELAPDPLMGLLPMQLLVGGSATNGTQKSLIRCAARGDHADKWLVKIGPKMLLTTGQAIPFKQWLHLPTSLRTKVQHTLEGGLALARKTRIVR